MGKRCRGDVVGLIAVKIRRIGRRCVDVASRRRKIRRLRRCRIDILWKDILALVIVTTSYSRLVLRRRKTRHRNDIVKSSCIKTSYYKM